MTTRVAVGLHIVKKISNRLTGAPHPDGHGHRTRRTGCSAGAARVLGEHEVVGAIPTSPIQQMLSPRAKFRPTTKPG